MDQVVLQHALDEAPRGRMSREEFYRWSDGRPGRYELVEGVVVRMNAERAGHVQVKMRLWQALDTALREAGLECQAFGDGMTVEVGERTNYEPDALVNCGARLPEHVIAAPNPVIVAEVTSPGTQSIDSTDKLADYFRVPSIQHHLIVSGSRREVVHHRRVAEGRTEAVILTSGPLRLDPPGITVTIEDFFVDLGS